MIPGTGLYLRDKVKVLNPSRGPEERGEVCGKSKELLIKLKPKVGKVVRRIPSNLKKLYDEHR